MDITIMYDLEELHQSLYYTPKVFNGMMNPHACKFFRKETVPILNNLFYIANAKDFIPEDVVSRAAAIYSYS